MGYLSVEIADDALIGAIAEENAITDRDLDVLEKRIEDPSTDTGRVAALALTIGRAGRLSSAVPLVRTRRRLEASGFALEASAVRLAHELVRLRPPAHLERAERGYRRYDPESSESLFIEDPVAAHWHLGDRWGPPLRPHPERSQRVARMADDVDGLARAVRDGEIVVVVFEPARFERPHPPLRLMRAGFSRDAGLASIVRWSEVRSIGRLEGSRASCAAFEVYGKPVEPLPSRSSIPADDLVELMTRLLKQVRS